MTTLTRTFGALLAFCVISCDGSRSQGGPLGYTAQLLFEVDGAHRGDVCITGVNAITLGAYPVAYQRGSLERVDVSWRGESGVLEIRGEHSLQEPRVVLFVHTLDAEFGSTPQVRTLEHEVDGHRLVIYAESLAQDVGCDGATHTRTDYDMTGDNDGGVPGDPNVRSTVPGLIDLHGTGPTDVWAVGYEGVVLHYDGYGWTQTVDDEDVSLLSVWASAPRGDVWLVAHSVGAEVPSRRLLRGRPGAWVEVNPGPLEGELLHRVWGASHDDVWVTGYIEDEGGSGRTGVVHHLTGGTWTMPASGVGGRLSGIWGSGPNDIFIGGSDGGGYSGYVAHFVDGHFDWNEYPDEYVGAIWGSSPNDVWTAGGTISHYDGSQWIEATPLPGRFHQFFGLWGSGPSDVWAVGSQGVSMQDYSGLMLHWNGSTWGEASVRPLSQVNQVWGSAANDVWAVGSGTIYHLDGSTWTLTAPSEIAITP